MRHLPIIALAISLLTACGDFTDSDGSGVDAGPDTGADVGVEVEQIDGIGECGYCSGTVDDPVWTPCRNPVPLSGVGGPDSEGACQCRAHGEEFPGEGNVINCVPDVTYCPCLLSGALCKWPTSTFTLDAFPFCACEGPSCTESVQCDDCE
jgi:hypothetical protein